MPLQLQVNDGPETARTQVITWDPDVYAETADARKRRAELEQQGFKVSKESDGEVVLDPPLRPENMNVFRVLSDAGDDRIVWDRTCPQQVKEAYQKFKELLKAGYTAFVVLASGKKGHKITEFDPSLQEILMAKGTEIMMVPKTVPG
jgi:hypothetical protein